MCRPDSDCDNDEDKYKWFDGGDATSFGTVCYKIGPWFGIINLILIFVTGIPSFLYGYFEGYGE